MPSERIQRRIDRLLDETEAAADGQDWEAVQRLADEVLGLDAENEDAPALLSAAERRLASGSAPEAVAARPGAVATPPATPPPPSTTPTAFASGRYEVRRFLGEGGKKRVFLAHDSLLDRDVAFALVRTEGLDATGRERVRREAQAMGRLGNHANSVVPCDARQVSDARPHISSADFCGGACQK